MVSRASVELLDCDAGPANSPLLDEPLVLDQCWRWIPWSPNSLEKCPAISLSPALIATEPEKGTAALKLRRSTEFGISPRRHTSRPRGRLTSSGFAHGDQAAKTVSIARQTPADLRSFTLACNHSVEPR